MVSLSLPQAPLLRIFTKMIQLKGNGCHALRIIPILKKALRVSSKRLCFMCCIVAPSFRGVNILFIIFLFFLYTSFISFFKRNLGK